MHRITLIPATALALKSRPPSCASSKLRRGIEWEEHIAGQQALDKFGMTLLTNCSNRLRETKLG